ncbi:MAG TPA: acyl-CoA synthetase [Dongiaceae bacterium]|nr:acyl-CoA synthetase [Dongiaceae bacterium]
MTALTFATRAQAFADRTAIVAPEGTFTYADLLRDSARVAGALLRGTTDLAEARVAFQAQPGYPYAAIQWGIWRAGGIAVPLAASHPPAELTYTLEDAGATIVVAPDRAAETLRPLAARYRARFLTNAEALAGTPGTLPDVAPNRRAMMVYTSGTTARPKGVVTTHHNIAAQVASLVQAWGWTADDRILLVLPLHHVHGIVNVLACALSSGAACEILARFDASAVWQRLASGDLTLFMAVPTIYKRLIDEYGRADVPTCRAWSEGAKSLRLMVSGSAALPVQTLERWREITGHTLLERYGMTEIGMALSNPLHGERRPGSVGVPLPLVEVKLADEAGRAVPEGTPGEILVRGPTVFGEYWKRKEATREAFRDGWFRTGDTAVVEDGRYRILGRTSVDIIKTGGFKVSALEIEEVLRTHPAIAECAVVGAPDPEWGERVSAAVELKDGAALGLDELQEWAKELLAPYKVPRALRCVGALPRNAMGKVMKPEVARLFAS